MGGPKPGVLIPATSFGTHADVADQILARAAELNAGAIVIGPETRHGPLAAPVGPPSLSAPTLT